MGQEIAFWTVAAVLIAAAIGVVWLRNIFRAALCLVLCFLSIAGVYIMLGADFLAAVQVLINIGAVAVLIILAIMMTREVERGSLPNRINLAVLGAAAIFVAVAVFAVLNTPWPVASPLPPTGPTTTSLGVLLFGQGGYVSMVEISGMMLLATIIGAIVLLREK